MIRESTASRLPLFREVGDFELESVGILEEDGVVVLLFIDRSFNITCASMDHDLSQPVDLADTIGPKGDSTLVGDVPR